MKPMLNYLLIKCPISFLVMALMLQSPLSAQKNKKNTIPQEEVIDTSSIEERLVKLAMAGPRLKVSDHQNKINEYQLKKTKNSWLNLLSISANYIPIQNPNLAAPLYPRNAFGINIPLGVIFSKGTDIKSAREALALSINNQDQLKLDIRADILSKYKQYQTFQALLLLQNEVLDDEQANFLQVEEKFKNRSATIEVYSQASKSYNSQRVQQLNLQLQQDLVKIEIERMIGVSLDSVLEKAK